MHWPFLKSIRRQSASRRLGPPCRRFGLLDGMILVGFAAVGFAGFKAGLELYSEIDYQVQMSFEAVLLLATWLVLIYRLRRPRPSIRILTRQPGAVACFAVVVVHVILGFQASIMAIAPPMVLPAGVRVWPGPGLLIWWFLSSMNTPYGAVVLVCWALLVLGRRWRPELGWIDRLGRWIGWVWIIWLVSWPIYFAITNFDRASIILMVPPCFR
jgi:hypothetical protein